MSDGQPDPRTETYQEPEAQPAPGGRSLPPNDSFTVWPRRGNRPVDTAECPPQPVRFARAEITLPVGAQAAGVPVVSITPQEGLVYPGVMVRWGCPYEWLLREGILNVRLTVNEAMAYPLAERNANPREPILIPPCWKAGQTIRIAVSWTDPTLTGGTPIPFWAEIALGTDWPPVFADDSRNRVPRRIATLLPITVLPGGAFASVSPGIIRPTAGRVWLQTSPGTVATQRPQFSFATLRGGGAGNIAGHLNAVAPDFHPVEVHVDDLRDVFLGAPTAGAVTAPTVVNLHREVW